MCRCHHSSQRIRSRFDHHAIPPHPPTCHIDHRPPPPRQADGMFAIRHFRLPVHIPDTPRCRYGRHPPTAAGAAARQHRPPLGPSTVGRSAFRHPPRYRRPTPADYRLPAPVDCRRPPRGRRTGRAAGAAGARMAAVPSGTRPTIASRPRPLSTPADCRTYCHPTTTDPTYLPCSVTRPGGGREPQPGDGRTFFGHPGGLLTHSGFQVGLRSASRSSAMQAHRSCSSPAPWPPRAPARPPERPPPHRRVRDGRVRHGRVRDGEDSTAAHGTAEYGTREYGTGEYPTASHGMAGSGTDRVPHGFVRHARLSRLGRPRLNRLPHPPVLAALWGGILIACEHYSMAVLTATMTWGGLGLSARTPAS